MQMMGYDSVWKALFWGVLMRSDRVKQIMKRIFPGVTPYLLVLIFCVAGCATTYTPPSGCVDADGELKDSLILENISNPKHTGLILEMANLEFLKRSDVYSADDALKFLDQVEAKIDADTYTWEELMSYVVRESSEFNEAIGAEVILLSGYFQLLDKPVPISECDKLLLKKHLDRQRFVVQLSAEP